MCEMNICTYMYVCGRPVYVFQYYLGYQHLHFSYVYLLFFMDSLRTFIEYSLIFLSAVGAATNELKYSYIYIVLIRQMFTHE